MFFNLLFLLYIAVGFFYSYLYFHLDKTIDIKIINLTFVPLALLLSFYIVKRKIIDLNFDFKITALVSIFCLFYFGYVWLKFDNGLRFPIVSGWDSAAHFSMMRDMIEERKILLAGAKIRSYFFDYPEKLSEKPFGYPPGFYIPAALLALNIADHISQKNYLVFLINWFYLVQIFMVFLSLISFIYILKDFLDINKRKFFILPSFFYAVLFFFGLIQLVNLGIGFSSFIAFFFYFNLAFWFLIRLQKKNSALFYAMYLISLYLANSSWFLPVVAFVLFAFTPIIGYRNLGNLVLLLFFVAVIFHFSYWHIIPKDLNFSFAKDAIVNAGGGVQIFSLIFNFLIILAFMLFFRNKNNRKRYFLVFINSLIFLLFLSAVAGLQLFSSYKLNYYFYKSFVILVVMTLPILFYFFNLLLEEDKIWIKKRLNNWCFEFKIYKISKSQTVLDKFKFFKIYDLNLLMLFLIFLFYLIAQGSISKIGVSEYKSYFKIRPIVNREIYNSLLILNDIFDMKNYMLAVFPPGPATTLWFGALYGRNLEFFSFSKHWDNWVAKEEVLKDRFLEYIKQEKSKYKILIVDTDCWFSKKDKEEFKKVNNRVVFYNPGCVD